MPGQFFQKNGKMAKTNHLQIWLDYKKRRDAIDDSLLEGIENDFEINKT